VTRIVISEPTCIFWYLRLCHLHQKYLLTKKFKPQQVAVAKPSRHKCWMLLSLSDHSQKSFCCRFALSDHACCHCNLAGRAEQPISLNSNWPFVGGKPALVCRPCRLTLLYVGLVRRPTVVRVVLDIMQSLYVQWYYASTSYYLQVHAVTLRTMVLHLVLAATYATYMYRYVGRRRRRGDDATTRRRSHGRSHGRHRGRHDLCSDDALVRSSVLTRATQKFASIPTGSLRCSEARPDDSDDPRCSKLLAATIVPVRT